MSANKMLGELRGGEKLDAQDEAIKTQGLVLILKSATSRKRRPLLSHERLAFRQALEPKLFVTFNHPQSGRWSAIMRMIPRLSFAIVGN
jgi:hypothetical protein